MNEKNILLNDIGYFCMEQYVIWNLIRWFAVVDWKYIISIINYGFLIIVI